MAGCTPMEKPGTHWLNLDDSFALPPPIIPDDIAGIILNRMAHDLPAHYISVRAAFLLTYPQTNEYKRNMEAWCESEAACPWQITTNPAW